MSNPELEAQRKIFAENLKRELETHEKNQTDLASFIGVSSATTSDWINAKKMPRMDKIQSMANWFGIPKSVLLEVMSPEERGMVKCPPMEYGFHCEFRHKEDYEIANDILNTINQLTREEAQAVLDFAKFQLAQEKYKKDSLEGGEVG